MHSSHILYFFFPICIAVCLCQLYQNISLAMCGVLRQSTGFLQKYNIFFLGVKFVNVEPLHFHFMSSYQQYVLLTAFRVKEHIVSF